MTSEFVRIVAEELRTRLRKPLVISEGLQDLSIIRPRHSPDSYSGDTIELKLFFDGSCVQLNDGWPKSTCPVVDLAAPDGLDELFQRLSAYCTNE